MHWSFCAALSAASLSFAAQDTPAPGFALAPAPYPGASPFAATTTLSSGEFVVFDGLQTLQFAPDGTLLNTLGSLTTPVFPSFVRADPGEQLAFIGESSTGSIYRLVLGVNSNPEFLATLPFNYDAAFPDSGTMFVSAATCGFGCGNEVWRVDLSSHQTTLVAQVPGASGPLIFDSSGGLYYGSASDQFPPPPAGSAVWRWAANQLAGPLVLGLDDAQLVGSGFVGATRLVYDRRTHTPILMENNFATGENRIRRVLGNLAQSPILVEGRPFWSMANLTLHSDQGAARFLAYQPASGGTLSYTTTDFAGPAERFAVQPRRALATLSAPVPGQLHLGLTLGTAHGFARILVAPRATLPGAERAFVLAGLPCFLGLGLHSLTVVPGLVPLDSTGSLQLDFPDPGGIGGALAFQLWLLDAGQRPAGTSSVALL